MERQYICIDLKSYYASVECVYRGLDPLNTNLVVADASRTEKTICLAVSPALKAYGISGRARLFEVIQKVDEINTLRRYNAPNRTFKGKSHFADELKNDSSLELGFIIAPPQMSYYMETSTKIYGIYLKYIAPEDIHVYSIDEVFIDVTFYLKTYKMTARELAVVMIRDVLKETGITATAGIGTNMYLAKVAMDIVAKKMPADKDGVRIAELDEISYRKLLWTHKPLTDFWRIGRGYSKRLEERSIYTLGDIAECSVYNEDVLYKMFGVNAELLIDHAWGYEPCTIEDVKAYKPQTNSISTGQVLKCPYEYNKALLIVKEMTELLSLDLVSKGLLTKQIVITVGYDIENLSDAERRKNYSGAVVTDYYGRQIPKHSHGTENLESFTSSTDLLIKSAVKLFESIADKNLLVRRINITACNVIPESAVSDKPKQIDMFTDYEAAREKEIKLAKEKNMQRAIIGIKNKYGKNAVLKGMNLVDGGTTIERNCQVGGHKA